MSDPSWFQALGALMGMHWNSSGVTAVVMGSLKPHINRKAMIWDSTSSAEKGSRCSTRTARSIAYRIVMDYQVLTSQNQLDSLAIDNNAVQDKLDLYQQYFLLSDEGEWTAYLKV